MQIIAHLKRPFCLSLLKTEAIKCLSVLCNLCFDSERGSFLLGIDKTNIRFLLNRRIEKRNYRCYNTKG